MDDLFFTDPRDGKKYRTVKIGNKIWMAENLNYETGNSWCYGNNESNNRKYSRLYDWNTAMKACPAGWHLPTNDDWRDLIQAIGGENAAGKKLKSKTGWNNNGNGTDEFGFSALPGGYRRIDGYIYEINDSGVWWSATEDENNSGGGAYYRSLNSNFNDVCENVRY